MIKRMMWVWVLLLAGWCQEASHAQSQAQWMDAAILPHLNTRQTHTEGEWVATLDARFKQAVMLHNQAYVNDHLGSARQAKALFEVLVKQPSSPLYPYSLAYLGSVNALIGKLSGNPIEKLAVTADGLKKLKQANQSYRTVSVIIPILQANVCLAVPDFFHALPEAESAASYLLRVANQTPLHPDIEAEIYRLYGDVQRRKRQPKVAIVYWKKAVAIAPDSMGGRQAAAQLKKETE